MASGRTVQRSGVASARRAVAASAGSAARTGVRRLRLRTGPAVPGPAAPGNDRGTGRLAADSPRGTVLVTGSSGTATASRMISHVMVAAGLHPVLRTAGAGRVSTIAEPAGRVRRDSRAIGLLEVDEGSFPEVVRGLRNPAAVIITNLSEDLLDRYTEPAHIVTRLECALRRLPRDTVLILNADDPRVASLAAGLPNRRLYFGITDTTAGRTAAGPASVLPRCPRCGGGLSYSRVFTAHLGHWACTACGLQRPAPQISAAGIDPAAPVPAWPGAC